MAPMWNKVVVSGSNAELNQLTVATNITAVTVSGSFSGSLLGTATFAENIDGGAEHYVPLWSSNSALSSSILYQTQSGILLGSTTHHTPEAPDKLGIYAGVTDSYNLISGHGEIDNYFQINVKNFSGGNSASADIVVTADFGTETGGYADFGINSSGYINNGNGIGTASDAYLYVQDAGDLLIGNKSPNKRVVIFTGEGDAIDNARVFVDPSGSVGINTSIFDPISPEALSVQAVNTDTYNLITATSPVNNYTQFNIINSSNGTSASADIVATADNGTETENYIDMGINGSGYGIPNLIGGPNDAYLYSTGRMLHIGNTTPGEHIAFFVGGFDVEANEKFVLEPEKPHKMIGDFDITGSVRVVNNLTVGGTLVAEKFITEYVTSSVIYESGSTKFGDTLDDTHEFTGSLSVLGTISGSLVLPEGIVSSSQQATTWTVLSSSFATTASFAVTASYVSGAASTWDSIANKPEGLVSSSEQINTGSFTGSFTGTLIGTASAAQTSSFAVTASYLSEYPAFVFDGGTPFTNFVSSSVFDFGGVI